MAVLVVDDNVTGSKLLRAVLEAEGHAVITAGDGLEALDLLERHPVQAIISDLLMPGLDGYRLCREIRQDGRWRKIPFICYTAIYGSQSDEKLAFDLGADAYLRKPSSSATILGTLRASMEGARSGLSRPKESHEELDVLNAYSQPLVAELENKNFELADKSQLAELAVEVGVALTRRSDLDEVLQICCESMAKHLDAASARIWLYNEKKAALELQASFAADTLAERVRLGQAIFDRIARGRKPYRTNAILNELHAGEQEWGRREGIVAFAGYPLIVEDRLVGAVAVFTRKELSEATTTTLAAIADSLALGIQGKRTEGVLRESEERFRQLAENISEVFWMIEPTGTKVLYVSPPTRRFGDAPARACWSNPIPFSMPFIRRIASESSIPFRAGWVIPCELEYRIVRRDSAVRWIRNRAFPVCDPAGVVIRIAGVAEDVTEKRQLEMQLRQSQKMQAVGQLAGGVAHDFNNLLSVIVGHSELLEMSLRYGDQALESVTEIGRAAERATSLTRQLLAFSRQQVVEPRVLDLNAAVSVAEKMLRRIIGEDVQLTTSLQTKLSLVRADPGQIDQMLLNMAVNARDAMPEGGTLRFETSNVELNSTYGGAHPKLRSGRYVLLAVSDTGCGMTPAVQARIFEPFFTTKKVGQGTGLGLAVVHGIVEQCGGYVEVYSSPGWGSTFKIYLPAAEEPVAGASQTMPGALPRSRGETVLLVEDEPSVRAVTAVLLKGLGYRVLEAPNAEEALQLMRPGQEKIDLLITDLIMPGKSGMELSDTLRSRDPGLRVLFQSGYAGEAVLCHCNLKPEIAFLQKPFSVNALAWKVREVLDRHPLD